MRLDIRAPEGRALAEAVCDQYVICVDDDTEFVKSLELFLPDRLDAETPDGSRYQFLFFTDPGRALQEISELLGEHAQIAMVISDQQMPQMRGTVFLAHVHEHCPDCVRVLLTGHAGLDSAISAINDRLLDKYLTKPIHDQDDFTVTIRLLLNRYQMQRTIGSQSAALAVAFAQASAQAEALAAANRRLEMLDRLKSDFLDFVSHELRTSLTALSALEMIRPNTEGDDQALLLEAVQSGYHRLRNLVERGLDYIARVAERGREEFEVLDLREVVREAAGSVSELEPGQVAGASYPASPCLILGSPADLREVVRTLLDNAVKFSPAGSPIGIRLAIERESAVLAVNDKGVGIDAAILPELFRPFTIGDSLHHAKGSALSLAVASAIADSHGGDIRAESPGPKQGSTFFLRLPLRGAGAPAETRAVPRLPTVR